MADILDIAEQKGKEIAKAVEEKHGEPLDGFERVRIEKEIYARALHEAMAFFLQETKLKFDDPTLKELKNQLWQRGVNNHELKKSTPEELLANVIKIRATDALLLNNIVI